MTNRKKNKKIIEDEDFSNKVQDKYGGAEDDENDDDQPDDHLDMDPDDEQEDDFGEDEVDPIEDENLEKSEQAEEDIQEEIEEAEEEAENAEEIENDIDVDAELEGDMYTGETKVCYIKNLKKQTIVIDDDDNTAYANLVPKRVPDEERVTGELMTYYEMVRIIGTRAQMFNYGAPPLIEIEGPCTPAQKAYVELVANLTPYIIRRYLPMKMYEDWKISELIVKNIIDDPFYVPEGFNYDEFYKKTHPQENNK